MEEEERKKGKKGNKYGEVKKEDIKEKQREDKNDYLMLSI